MNPTIIFDNVSKKFSRSYASDSLRDALAAPFRRLFGSNGTQPAKPDQPVKQSSTEFWALRDVSFEVKPGEALGIIGHNGSGKSTTLKLLSRILRPDGGRIIVKGRIGALIELAAGFHPDLTGRENVFLNASILGMNKDDIAKKYDEIVDFAELQEFMDTPVKWYSSGMYARLGFAVASHIDPEVLLVDEVLSVGDIGFQQKCEKKIQSIKEKGLTIVFVSHNMSAISAICDKVLVLNKGNGQFLGSSQEAISIYTNLLKYRREAHESELILKEFHIHDSEGNSRNSFESTEACSIRLTLKALVDLEKINIGVRIRKNENGYLVFASNYSALTGERLSIPKDKVLKITFGLVLNLARGGYALELTVWDHARNHAIMNAELGNMIINNLAKTDGIAFLSPRIDEFFILGE